VIEFDGVRGGETRTYILQVSTIATVTATSDMQTALTLTDGTELTASAPHQRFRDALRTARSGFVSLVEAPA
jgi:hypothetical protein